MIGWLVFSVAEWHYQKTAGALQADTWYQMALGNALAGQDLNGATSEMQLTYSQNFNWYYGTDGFPPADQYNFETVVLHEIGHGLSFSDSMSVSEGLGYWGFGSTSPVIYDRLTKNGSGQALLSFPYNSSQLDSQLTSNNIYFDGPYTRSANGGNPARTFAPSAWQSGSSY